MVGDWNLQSLIPEGERAGSEECAHNFGAQGGDSVGLPYGRGIVTAFAQGGQGGHAQRHDG